MHAQQNRNKLKSRFGWLMTACIAMLGLATVNMIITRDAETLLPSAETTRPSGMMVLADLLRHAGYKVEIARKLPIKAEQHDVVVTVRAGSARELWARDSQFSEVQASLVAPGATLLIMVLPTSFNQDAKLANEQVGQNVRQNSNPKAPPLSITKGQQPAKYSDHNYLFSDQISGIVWVSGDRSLPGVLIDDASMATNQHIGDRDNAQFMLTVFRAITRPNSKIIFNEYDLVGPPGDDSIYEAMGKPAVAAYWQFILVVLASAFMWSKRFGPPVSDAMEVRSTRSLLNAFGDTMQRAKRSDLALRLIYRHIDLRVRRAVNLSPQASLRDRDSLLPQSTILALHGLQDASLNKSSLTKIASLVRAAFSELEALEAAARVGRSRVS